MVCNGMFANLSPVLRLVLFLFVSAGMHGGLVFYGWLGAPAESRLTAGPVTISLLPAVAPLPKQTKTQPLQASVAERPNKPAPPEKKLRAPSLAEVHKPRIKKPSPVAAAKPVQEESQASEPAFTKPNEIVPEVSSADDPKASMEAVEQVELTSLSPGESKKTVKVPSSLSSPSLVEAVPRNRSNPLPGYPRLARRNHWQGVVWLLVEVSSAGMVEGLHVEESSGYKLLDRAAARTVRRWQFSPATRGGLAVSSQVRIPVRFRLEDG